MTEVSRDYWAFIEFFELKDFINVALRKLFIVAKNTEEFLLSILLAYDFFYLLLISMIYQSKATSIGNGRNYNPVTLKDVPSYILYCPLGHIYKLGILAGRGYLKENKRLRMRTEVRFMILLNPYLRKHAVIDKCFICVRKHWNAHNCCLLVFSSNTI